AKDEIGLRHRSQPRSAPRLDGRNVVFTFQHLGFARLDVPGHGPLPVGLPDWTVVHARLYESDADWLRPRFAPGRVQFLSRLAFLPQPRSVSAPPRNGVH